MNYLNSFSVDDRVETGARPRARAQESWLAQLSILGASLFYAIILLGAKSLLSLLGKMQPRRKFLRWVVIMEESGTD